MSNDPNYNQNQMNPNQMNERNAMNEQKVMSEEERIAAQTPSSRPTPMREEERIAAQTPSSRPAPMHGEGGSLGWLKNDEVDDLKARWSSIQAKFVDEPRTSVEQADALVADTLVRIEKAFSNNRASLAGQKDISTEDLRVALQSYRSFLNRLLAI